MILIGAGVGGLVLILLVVVISAMACGGDSGRREVIADSLAQVIEQCRTLPDGSSAAYFAAPGARARLQPILCQVTSNTEAAIRNEDRTPEYGVEGSTVEQIIRASGVPDISRCSIFQNDNSGTAMVVGCAMPNPVTGEDAMFLTHLVNPAVFTP